MKEEGKFEESWRKVFEGAEASPSDSVWSGIDHDLANAEGKTMKKRVVFYQRLAAASILFAFLAAAFGLYRWMETGTNQLAQKNVLENRSSGLPKEKNENGKAVEENRVLPKDSSDLKKLKQSEKIRTETLVQKTTLANTTGLKSAKDFGLKESNQNKLTEKEDYAIEKEIASKNKAEVRPNEKITDKKILRNESTTSAISQYARMNQHDSMTTFFQDDKKSIVYKMSSLPSVGLLPVVEVEGEPVLVELVPKLPAISGAFMNRINKETPQEKLWASVTAASGSYNSNVSSYSNLNFSSTASNVANSSLTGNSYSLGMMGGMRVLSRVVIQTGIQYLNQSVGSVSNINATAGTLASVANHLSNPSAFNNSVSSYNLVSATEFLSIPVQAGYLIINKKLGWQMNAGVATDFFVRNTLSDPNGQFQSYSHGAGPDSPYRSLNFAGMVNSEVSYKLSSRYRVSIVPGLKYSFSPLLKSTVNTTGNPMLWDVGLRIRYIFR